MAVLYFSGDQVAFFGGIDDTGSSTSFSSVDAPFLSSDVVEIEVPDQYIQANGEFDFNEVQFSRVTVIRDDVRYDFEVDSGSKIKETGGSDVKEAGDSFFTTNDSVGPPASGPFAGLDTEKMVFSTDSTFSTGQSTTIERSSSTDLNGDGDTSDAGETGNSNFNARQAETLPCFAAGTLIDTTYGLRSVETLRAGDMVHTLNRGPQPVRWVRTGSQSLDGAANDQKPVLIGAGALGPGYPDRDLIVSPHHRILVGGADQLEGRFPIEAFVPAKALTVLPGVRHMRGKRDVTWVHFAFDQHQVVSANACLTESLLLGPVVMNGLTRTDLCDLKRVFGPSPPPGIAWNSLPARPCLTVRLARSFLARRLGGENGKNRNSARPLREATPRRSAA